MKLKPSYGAILTIFSLSLPLGLLPLKQAQANNDVVNNLLDIYASQGASTANAEQGKKMWLKGFKREGETVDRSCATCHTQDLTATGKHVKTNKAIEPMSPTVNPDRLTETKKIEKWFKRNCKWTYNRECSVQEKADFLVYINNTTNF